jgi:hypothetical protein
MSAFPPLATELRTLKEVRVVPTADIRHGGGLSADHPPMGNRVGLFLGAVQSRIAQFSRMLPSWIAGEADHD